MKAKIQSPVSIYEKGRKETKNRMSLTLQEIQFPFALYLIVKGNIYNIINKIGAFRGCVSSFHSVSSGSPETQCLCGLEAFLTLFPVRVVVETEKHPCNLLNLLGFQFPAFPSLKGECSLETTP